MTHAQRRRSRQRHLTNGAAGWLVLSVAAVLPMIWTFTLVMHFARPTIMRFLQSLTLRFGGDVWWLSYVLFRDALLVITLGLGMLFFMPNLYFVAGAADHGAALGRAPVLGAVRQDRRATRMRTSGPSGSSASCSSSPRSCTSSRRSTGWRPPTRRTSATCRACSPAAEPRRRPADLLGAACALFAHHGRVDVRPGRPPDPRSEARTGVRPGRRRLTDPRRPRPPLRNARGGSRSARGPPRRR